MNYSYYKHSEIGAHRTSNQDVILVDAELGVYILCDGMGGTPGGDTAARIASDVTMRYLRDRRDILVAAAQEKSPPLFLQELAQAAIHESNHAVHAHNQTHQELRGSGTTIALLITAGSNGLCAHIGDSRVYVSRDDTFLQLTKDHTLAQDLIDRGVLKPELRKDFAFNHVLSRAVGLLPAVSADILLFEILPNDILLLSSDGVSPSAARAVLQGTVYSDDLSALMESLFSHIRQDCGNDDSSAILIGADPQENTRKAQAARREQIVLTTTILRELFLFRDVAPQNILRIVGNAEIIECAHGQTVVYEGDPEESLYVILDGTFIIESGGQMISQLTRGNHFGEMALLTNQVRSASVCAATEGTALRISAADFHQFIREHPQDGVAILSALAKELSERLRATNGLVRARG